MHADSQTVGLPTSADAHMPDHRRFGDDPANRIACCALCRLVGDHPYHQCSHFHGTQLVVCCERAGAQGAFFVYERSDWSEASLFDLRCFVQTVTGHPFDAVDIFLSSDLLHPLADIGGGAHRYEEDASTRLAVGEPPLAWRAQNRRPRRSQTLLSALGVVPGRFLFALLRSADTHGRRLLPVSATDEFDLASTKALHECLRHIARLRDAYRDEVTVAAAASLSASAAPAAHRLSPATTVGSRAPVAPSRRPFNAGPQLVTSSPPRVAPSITFSNEAALQTLWSHTPAVPPSNVATGDGVGAAQGSLGSGVAAPEGEMFDRFRRMIQAATNWADVTGSLGSSIGGGRSQSVPSEMPATTGALIDDAAADVKSNADASTTGVSEPMTKADAAAPSADPAAAIIPVGQAARASSTTDAPNETTVNTSPNSDAADAPASEERSRGRNRRRGAKRQDAAMASPTAAAIRSGGATKQASEASPKGSPQGQRGGKQSGADSTHHPTTSWTTPGGQTLAQKLVAALRGNAGAGPSDAGSAPPLPGESTPSSYKDESRRRLPMVAANRPTEPNSGKATLRPPDEDADDDDRANGDDASTDSSYVAAEASNDRAPGGRGEHAKPKDDFRSQLRPMCSVESEDRVRCALREATAPRRTVNVSFLPVKMTDRAVSRLLWQYGEYVRVRTRRPQATGDTLANGKKAFFFVFVEFVTQEAADRCVEDSHKIRLGDFLVRIQRASGPIRTSDATDAHVTPDGLLQRCTFAGSWKRMAALAPSMPTIATLLASSPSVVVGSPPFAPLATGESPTTTIIAASADSGAVRRRGTDPPTDTPPGRVLRRSDPHATNSMSTPLTVPRGAPQVAAVNSAVKVGTAGTPAASSLRGLDSSIVVLGGEKSHSPAVLATPSASPSTTTVRVGPRLAVANPSASGNAPARPTGATMDASLVGTPSNPSSPMPGGRGSVSAPSPSAHHSAFSSAATTAMASPAAVAFVMHHQQQQQAASPSLRRAAPDGSPAGSGDALYELFESLTRHSRALRQQFDAEQQHRSASGSPAAATAETAYARHLLSVDKQILGVICRIFFANPSGAHYNVAIRAAASVIQSPAASTLECLQANTLLAALHIRNKLHSDAIKVTFDAFSAYSNTPTHEQGPHGAPVVRCTLPDELNTLAALAVLSEEADAAIAREFMRRMMRRAACYSSTELVALIDVKKAVVATAPLREVCCPGIADVSAAALSCGLRALVYDTGAFS